MSQEYRIYRIRKYSRQPVLDAAGRVAVWTDREAARIEAETRQAGEPGSKYAVVPVPQR